MKKYPFKGWILQPSMKPVELTFIKHGGWSRDVWHRSQAGKSYHEDAIFDSKQAAIQAGRAICDNLEAKLAKQAETLKKRRAALDKADAADKEEA